MSKYKIEYSKQNKKFDKLFKIFLKCVNIYNAYGFYY